MIKKLVVGTRGSKLALTQTESIVASLQKVNPDIDFSIIKIQTAGDRDRRTSLDKMGIAIFVKELEEALLDKRIDIAVHSLKDVPTELPAGLELITTPPREDPRDALVAKAKLDELPAGSCIGTGSLLRAVEIIRYRADLKTCPIRGNVDTRLRKVASGETDGVIVAVAAMARLGRTSEITEYLPQDKFLPSVGQGALVIEGRRDDAEIKELVGRLNHLPTWQNTLAERAFLRTLGGGCRAPIAALGAVTGGILSLKGMIASIDGKRLLQGSDEGPAADAEVVGNRLARQLLRDGADEFIAEVIRQ